MNPFWIIDFVRPRNRYIVRPRGIGSGRACDVEFARQPVIDFVRPSNVDIVRPCDMGLGRAYDAEIARQSVKDSRFCPSKLI